MSARSLLLLVSLALAASSSSAAPRDNLNSAARDFVRLELAVGEKEDGYIDAYYGPAALKAEGQARQALKPARAAAPRRAASRSGRSPAAGRIGAKRRRARFLSAQLTARE